MTPVFEIGGDDRGETVILGVAEALDAGGVDLRATGQRDAGVGAADIGNERQGSAGRVMGGLSCQAVVAVGIAPPAGECLIGRFRGPCQGFEIDMHDAEALFVAERPFVIVQERPDEIARTGAPSAMASRTAARWLSR
jgi:hypothetical protein